MRVSKTEEPCAGKPHAGICEGGIGQLVALPRYGSISLKYNLKSTDASMSIYSLSGKQLARKSLTALTGSTNWSPNFAAGTYVFEIRDGVERIAKQIILK